MVSARVVVEIVVAPVELESPRLYLPRLLRLYHSIPSVNATS